MTDRDHQAFTGLPGPFNMFRRHDPLELLIDLVGGGPERDFAQRGEMTFLEKMLGRPIRPLLGVDLSLLESFEEFVGGDIDQFDLVGEIQD